MLFLCYRGENNQGPMGPRPLLRGSAHRSTGLGARQAPRNFRGYNIEFEKYIDISTPGPADSDEGP